MGKIYTQNSWVDKSGNPLMSDLQNFRIYALPEDRAIIDLDLTLLAEHGDVFFGDTKEGGIITVRVNPQMNASNETGKIENALQSGSVTHSFNCCGSAETLASWNAAGKHTGLVVLFAWRMI